MENENIYTNDNDFGKSMHKHYKTIPKNNAE